MRSREEQAALLELRFFLHDAPFGYHWRERSRDDQTLTRRFANEGFRFLSVTLPKLASEILSSLTGNRNFTPSCAFKAKKGAAYPRFLGSAFERVYLPDGSLRPPGDICVKTVKWLLTFCYWVYKAEIPFDEAQIEAFADNFRSTEDGIGKLDNTSMASDPLFDQRITLMRNLLGDIFQDYSRDHKSFRPGFGPGISADVARERRYNWKYRDLVQSGLPQHFGLSMFITYGEYTGAYTKWLRLLLRMCASSFALALSSVLPPVDYAKVLFVPKDSRGPRVIACEPSYNMWVQQGVRRYMQHAIEGHWVTRGQVNFEDQGVNQDLCYVPEMATLDLKDASDLVSLDLVSSIFPTNLLEDILACRTKYAKLPSKEDGLRVLSDTSYIELKKFAPMGSALCFPVMSIVNFSAIVAGECLYSGKSIAEISKLVFVYGDDIVVPSYMAARAIDSLHSVGLRVNIGKSFVDSRFKESCGEYVLDGQSVRPLRRKHLHSGFVRKRDKGKFVYEDSGWLVSSVDLANRCWESGYASLAYAISSQVESVTGPLPPRRKDVSGYLGWDSEVDFGIFCQSLANKGFRRFSDAPVSDGSPKREFRIWVVRDRVQKTLHSDDSIVRRMLCEGGQEEPLDPTRLGMRKPFYASVDAKPWYQHLLVPVRKQNALQGPWQTLVKG